MTDFGQQHRCFFGFLCVLLDLDGLRLFIHLFPVLPVPVVLYLTVQQQLSLAKSQIVHEIALVNVPISPIVYPVPVLLVDHVMPLVHFTCVLWILPNSVPVSTPLFEVALIMGSIVPAIFTIPFRQTIHKLPLVLVPVGVYFDSVSMFKAIFEFSHIKIPIGLLMLAVAIWQPAPPGSVILL